MTVRDSSVSLALGLATKLSKCETCLKCFYVLGLHTRSRLCPLRTPARPTPTVPDDDHPNLVC